MLLWLPLAALVFVSLWYTERFANNIPHFQDWDLLEVNLGAIPLTWQYLWEPVTESRLPIYKLLTYAWANVTNHNSYYQAFWFPIGLLALTLWLLTLFNKRLSWLVHEKIIFSCGFFLISFSLAHNSGFIDTTVFCYLLINTSFIFFSLMISRTESIIGFHMTFAWLAILLGYFTMANGMAMIFVLIIYSMIKWCSSRKHHLQAILTLVAGIALVYAYFVKTAPSKPMVWNYSNQANMFYFISHPVEAVVFMLNYTGSAVSGESISAAIYAAVLYTAFSLAIYKKARGRFRQFFLNDFFSNFFLVLFITAFFAAAIVTAGRLSLGTEFALRSRYFTWSIVLNFAIWGYLFQSFPTGRIKRGLLLSFFLLAMSSYMTGWYRGFYKSDKHVTVIAERMYIDCVKKSIPDFDHCLRFDTVGGHRELKSKTLLLLDKKAAFFKGI